MNLKEELARFRPFAVVPDSANSLHQAVNSEQIQTIEGHARESDKNSSEALKLIKRNLLVSDAISHGLSALDEKEREHRRALAEKDKALKGAITSLIEILDGVESVASYISSGHDGILAQNVMVLARSAEDNLRDLGIVKMECLGQAFDPSRHRVVATEERDTAQEREVISVRRAGYFKCEGHSSRVFRFADVVVAARRQRDG